MVRKTRLQDVQEASGSGYPAPYDAPCRQRHTRRLSDAVKVNQFGVNQVRLSPGAWSAQRHWHTHEDELVYMLEGEAVLITDHGEQPLRPGDVVGFPAGEANGHHLVNRSEADCVFLAIGNRDERDEGHYSDIDLHAPAGRYAGGFHPTRKDGSPL